MKEKIHFESLKKAIYYAFFFVAILWATRIIGYLFGSDFYTLGILPRTTIGLRGIITAPFIHADFRHLIANSLPIFVLTALIFIFYRSKAVLIYIYLWLTSGLLTWFIGRPAWHLGVSSIIYALASFLIFGGILSKNFRFIIASLIVIILYAGLIWGIFPNDNRISWEGHLAGAVSGLIWGYNFRKAFS